MTTTPNPTAEQIIEEVLHPFPERVWLSHRIVARLRAAGLLGGDPTEEQIERAHDAGMNAVDWDMVREGVDDPAEAASIAVRIALAAAGVAPQELSAHVNPLATSGERVRNPAESSHVARPEPESTDNGRCGGCRDLGPHRNVPGCDYYTPKPAPSPDSEKLIAEATNKLWQYFNPGFAPISEEHPDWEFYREAAALAAQPVLAPEKVADFLEGTGDEWQFKFDRFLSETGSDPGPYYDYLARALCEAAKRGEMSA